MAAQWTTKLTTGSGETTALDRLRKAWSSQAPLLFVCGPPGAGKSSLLRAYAAEQDKTPTAIVLPDHIDDDRKLDEATVEGRVVCTYDDRRQLPRTWLDRRIDAGLSFAIESRREPDDPVAEVVRLQGLDRQEACELLNRSAIETNSDQALARLVDLVGGLPGALSALAVRLRTFDAQYVESWLRRAPTEVLSSTAEGERMVGEFQQIIGDLPDDARRVLEIVAQFQRGLELDALRHIFGKTGQGSGSIEEAIQECSAWGLLRSSTPTGVIRSLPLAAALLSSHEESSGVDYDEEIAAYLDWTYERLRSARSDDELTSRLSHLEYEAPQLLDFMGRQIDGDLDLSASTVQKLVRLIVEYGLRRATESDHREAITNLVDHYLERDDLRSKQLESMARWLERIGRLDEAYDTFSRAIESAESPPPRLYWRWSCATQYRGDRKLLRETVQRGLNCLDDRESESLSLERIILLLADRRCDELDDFLDSENPIGQMESLDEDDALHRLDAHLEACLRIARRQWMRHHFEAQRRSVLSALRRAESIEDRGWIPTLKHALTTAEIATGSAENSLEKMREIRHQYEEIGYAIPAATVTGTIAARHHYEDDVDRSLDLYRSAVEALQEFGTVRPRQNFRFSLGCALFEARQFQDALQEFRIVRKEQLSYGAYSIAGRTALVESWIHVWLENFDAARKQLQISQEHFDKVGLEYWKALVELSRREFLGEGIDESSQKQLREQLDAAPVENETRYAFKYLVDRGLPDEAITTLRRRSMLFRILLIVTENFDRRGEPEARGELYVGSRSCWFRRHGRERVDIRSRGSLRRILTHLVELHASRPGSGSDVDELFEIGWPGEKASGGSAANRVYWAIRTLRTLGLDDILLTDSEGYLLDSKCSIVVESDESTEVASR